MFVKSIGYASVGLSYVAAGTLRTRNFVYSVGFIGYNVFGGTEKLGNFVISCEDCFYVMFS